ncbi:MAG: hypothetical protein PF572_00915 [Patescibacteria group bacterium]|jgi:hypothetical protein|nr:hypothetical protein [Patescibacteria group bacterium]
MKNILKIFIISFILFSPFAIFAAIENIDNAGFVPGPIWFSKYPVFVDDEVKIYTALYNNSQYNISGELHFFNNEGFIGDTGFEMPANSGAHNVWIDWVAEKGEIEVGAEIKNVSIINSIENIVADIDFKETQIAKSKIFIDFDNDKDGIGNIADDDDDNDGKNDLAEIAEGTNPFEHDQIISTTTPNEDVESEIQIVEEKGFLDKIDDSVMGFLNKITQNKVDGLVDSLSISQIEKLETKKGELEEKITDTLYNSLDNIVQLKTVKSTSTASSTEIAPNPPDLTITSEYLPKDLNEAKVKNKISVFFKNLFSKTYLLIVNVLIFFLSHTIFLFLLIFFIVYLVIRKIFKFFVG